MPLEALEIVALRGLAELRLEPAPGLTIICGANAQGKTTILEAAALLALGRSFRTTRDRECIPLQLGPGGRAMVRGAFRRNGVRHAVHVAIGAEGKVVLLDEKPVRSLSELVGRFPIVLLLPEDLQLARGIPAARRRLADGLLAQLDPAMLRPMIDYEAALRGRGALLRRGVAARDPQYDAFEDVMARAGARLLSARTTLARSLARLAAEPMRVLGNGAETIDLAHEPGIPVEDPAAPPDSIAPALRSRWAAAREGDLAAAQTREGPHRGDIVITINGLDARRYGSQGQCRTAVLALRIAETCLLAERLHEPPTLLLDDVLGELDEGRAERFLALVARSGAQALVATTDTRVVEAAGLRGTATVWRLRDGKLSAEAAG